MSDGSKIIGFCIDETPQYTTLKLPMVMGLTSPSVDSVIFKPCDNLSTDQFVSISNKFVVALSKPVPGVTKKYLDTIIASQVATLTKNLPQNTASEHDTSININHPHEQPSSSDHLREVASAMKELRDIEYLN